ncbi:MAG: DNA gyrase inhibitor YacG [Rhizobiales bacterium]|nr:DNA gyrase inhibitor YacG [Hyphomicrobiales bacterium]
MAERKRAPGGACPICGKPREPAYRPFCSKRCADIDLGRWLGGRYAIPVTPESDEDGETPDGGAGMDEAVPPVRRPH